MLHHQRLWSNGDYDVGSTSSRSRPGVFHRARSEARLSPRFSVSAILRERSIPCIVSSVLSYFITYERASHIQQSVFGSINRISHYFTLHMVLYMKTMICWKSWPKTGRSFRHPYLPWLNAARRWQVWLFHARCKHMSLFPSFEIIHNTQFQ